VEKKEREREGDRDADGGERKEGGKCVYTPAKKHAGLYTT